jgi:hypothetical protein
VIALEDPAWYWWVDHITTTLGIPLALIGFGVTWWQLKKTKSAAEAAAKAAEQTQGQLKKLNLVSLLPQLARIEEGLDEAVVASSAQMLRFWIASWRWQAGEIRGYLNSDNADEKRIMKSIQASIASASDVRNLLHTTPPTQLVAMTTDLRKLMGKVTGELGTLTAKQTARVGDDGTGE